MDINNLMENVRSFFSEQYKGVEHTESYIAFEPLGTMIDPDDFKDENNSISEIKAMEQISILGDRLPEIDNIFFATTSRLSEVYEVLVESSRFYGTKITSEDKTGYIAKLAEVQMESRQKIEDGDKASIVTPEGSYLPIYAYPRKWYDPNGSFWVNKIFSATEPKTPLNSKTTLAVGKPIPMVWRTKLSVNPAISKIQVDQPIPEALENIKSSMVFRKNIPLERITVRDHRTPLVNLNALNLKSRIDSIPIQSTGTNATEPKPAIKNLNLLSKFNLANRILVTNLIINNDAQNIEPVKSNEFSMSFDYCIVQLNRPWYNTELFHFSNIWYALALNEGYFSNGLKDESNKGVFKSIPNAMILIKNLKIRAAWTNEEKLNAANNVGLGIFNLKDSMFVNNELVIAGMQIIGWICEVIPKLPVANDPNMT